MFYFSAMVYATCLATFLAVVRLSHCEMALRDKSHEKLHSVFTLDKFSCNLHRNSATKLQERLPSVTKVKCVV